MAEILSAVEIEFFQKRVLFRQVRGGKRPVALVADDDPIARFLVADMLLDFGYDTIAAHNGREALSFYNEKMDEVVLVVTDNEMPELNGLDLIQTIKATDCGTALVLLSASNGEIAVKAEAEGAAFVLKPPDTRTLFNAVIKAASDCFR